MSLRLLVTTRVGSRAATAVVVALAFTLVAASAHAQPAPPSAPAPAPACTGTVDGHVVDMVSHVPLADVTVSLAGRPVARTDADGRFTLGGLCPGSITLDVGRDDYLADTRALTLVDHAAVELALVSLAPSEVVELRAEAPPDVDMRSTVTKTGAALERTRGRNFADALSDIPGVTQLRSGGGAAKPIIRGQYGRRLLILVDGIRHRAQEWGLEHAPEIDPFIAGALTVVRGASGVRLGPDAIGGAILVEPPPLLSGPGYAGELHLIGQANTPGAGLAARLQGATAGGYAAQLEGSLRAAGGLATPLYPLDNTGAREWTLGATVGRGETYRLSYRHYRARLGVCSCLRMDSIEQFRAQLDRDLPRGVELYRSDFGIDRPSQAVDHDLVLARGTWTRGRLGTLTATYAFQHDLRDEYDVVRQATTGSQFHFRLFTHDADLTFAHRPLHVSPHLHLHGSVGVAAMVQTNRYSGLQLVPSHDGWSGGAFAIERLVGHDFELEAGVRFDVVRRTAGIERRDFSRLVRSGQIAADGCRAPAGTDPEAAFDCASTFAVPSLSIGALRQLTEAWSVKLDLSTATRPPSPDEQYLNGTAPTFPVLALGKPDLGSETTYSTSLTLAVDRHRLRGEASVYGNLIDDYIYFAPAIDANGRPIFDTLIRGVFPRFVTRPVDAVFYGADGGVTVTPVDWLELGAQASLVRARNRTDNSYLVFVPPDRLAGTATVRRAHLAGAHEVFATVSGTYVARQDRFDLAADLAPPPAGYALLGVEAGAELHDGDRIFKLALAGSNLTNARYRDYTSLLRYFADQPGWEAVLRLSLHFTSPQPQP